MRVVDLSTLLPGPLATRLLADAGAEVIKIERPGGDDLKRYGPVRDGVPVLWSWLNAGKRIVELDLKRGEDRARALDLIAGAQVLVEQFRPGVLARLGLAPDELRRRFPGLVLCSITGYGQASGEAGHDLTYQARAGLLDRGAPAGLPTALVADIAGGSWPAVVNILLALRRAERGGGGSHLDVAMTANLAPFLLWPLAELDASGNAPAGGTLELEGASPRYGLYACADGVPIAVAALEDAFWQRFTGALDLPIDADRAAVAARLAAAPAAHWLQRLTPLDCCVAPVATIAEAVASGAIGLGPDGPAWPVLVR